MSPRARARSSVGYWGACSTYGSFSYLKYGLMRLFSQLAQDCPLKVGKVIWVVGHSGPETAEDSRTHFGIFAPGVTQLFPDGHVINLHPWEHNEVAPAARGRARDRRADRRAAPDAARGRRSPTARSSACRSHLDAARGAYVITRPRPEAARRRARVIVQGTSTTESVYKLLPRLLAGEGPNVKLVAGLSWELFQLPGPGLPRPVLPARGLARLDRDHERRAPR